jgi:oligopeptide transport system permease protein
MTTARNTAETSLETYAQLLGEARELRGTSLGRDAWRRLRKNRTAMAALAFLTLLAVLAGAAPLLPLQAPRKVETSLALAAPRIGPLLQPTADWIGPAGEIDEDALEAGYGEQRWLSRRLLSVRAALFGRYELVSCCGRDALGRDVLSRLFWGARISIAVGLVAALVSLVVGVSYGAVAGYVGGWIDNLMMRIVDILYSVPFIFVVIFIIMFLSEEQIQAALLRLRIDRIVIFFIVIGLVYWLTMARVVRGQVISLKNEQFVEAARTLGASRPRIIFLHLVPNLLSVIIVYLTLTIPRVMLFEAFLSFLGLGVEPPDVSWGLLANEGVRVITPIRVYWWLVVFPGLALSMTLLSLNFLGDGLRDALDPRLKHR